MYQYRNHRRDPIDDPPDRRLDREDVSQPSFPRGKCKRCRRVYRIGHLIEHDGYCAGCADG